VIKMLPIIEFPQIVRDYEGCFTDVFTDKRQINHFHEYLTGLMVSNNVTVTGINNNFVYAKNQSSLNRFLTKSKWDETKLNNMRLNLLQQKPRTKWNKFGCVSIDDVLAHKTGENIEGVAKFYDHVDHKYVIAHNIVTSQYVDKRTGYPMDYRVYFKKDSDGAKKYGFKTKIELGCELIDHAVEVDCPATTFAFDSWYLAPKLTDTIRGHERDWVSRCKSNRKVRILGRYIQIKKFAKTLHNDDFRRVNVGDDTCYWAFTKTVQVTKLGRVRIVISYDNEELEGNPVYIITNRKDWDCKQTLKKYSFRQPIEPFYRDTKQHLGLEDCQLRNLQGIKRHWYLVLLAYSLIKLSVCENILSRWENPIETIGDGCRCAEQDVLEALVVWVYKQLLNEKNPMEVVKMLIA